MINNLGLGFTFQGKNMVLVQGGSKQKAEQEAALNGLDKLDKLETV